MGTQKRDQLILQADGWLSGNSRDGWCRWNWPLMDIKFIRHLCKSLLGTGNSMSKSKEVPRTCHVWGATAILGSMRVGMAQTEWLERRKGAGENVTKAAESHAKKCWPYLIHQWILNLTGYWNYLGEPCKNTNSQASPTYQLNLTPWWIDLGICSFKVASLCLSHRQRGIIRIPFTVLGAPLCVQGERNGTKCSIRRLRRINRMYS